MVVLVSVEELVQRMIWQIIMPEDRQIVYLMIEEYKKKELKGSCVFH